MKNSRSSLLLLFIFLPIISKAALPEIPESMQEAKIWKLQRLEQIREIRGKPDEMIPKLSEMYRQLKMLGYRSSAEKDEITQLLLTELTTTPGHAKYYQDKIESLKAQVLANAKLSSEEVAKRQLAGGTVVNTGDYDKYRENAFLVLGMLPSSEAVAVLGFYLDDPVGRDHYDLLGRPIEGTDVVPPLPNADYAARAMRKLGIEHPPFTEPYANPHDGVFDGEVDAWKSWWNDVKTGKRTYQFIGSNIQYGPDGPASREVIERAERHQKRDNERTMGHKKSSAPSEYETAITQTQKPSSIAWLIAAIGFIGAVWYFLKNRKPA